MKFSFNLKNKEASLQADIEGLVEKGLEHRAKVPARKKRAQLKQEEKRKNEELKHRQQMQWIFIMLGLIVAFIVLGVITTVLGI